MSKFSINVIITIVAKVLKIGLAIITSIVIANSIGPEGQGIYKLAILFPGLLIVFGNVGLGQALIFFTNKKSEQKQEILNTLLTTGLIIALALFLIGLLILVIFGETIFPKVPMSLLIYGLFATPFLFVNSLIGAVFLSQKNAKIYNFAKIANSVIFLIFLILFMCLNKLDTKLTITGFSLTSLIAFLYLVFLFYKKGNKFRISLDLKIIKESILYGVRIFISQLMVFLQFRFDSFVINYFISPASVGIYAVAATLSEKTWVVSQSVGEMIFPKTASDSDSNTSVEFTIRTFKLVLILTIIIAIILFLVSGFLINLLYPQEYIASVIPFKILLIGSISIGGWRVLINDLYGRNIMKPVIILGCISALINIILGILFIKNFGIIGAAWASSLTYSLTLLGIMLIFSSHLKISFKQLITLNKEDIAFFKRIVRYTIKTKKKNG